ncbi:MAG: helix-turn-helix transcriptional regulator [Oscillibacter sp.]|nr:helix-turn-helix transcriptional regulator [Oscillibacter sp.]
MQEKKELNIAVGANIQKVRELNGYTQEQLSEILNITPNHLSAIERGVTGATLEKIVQLCNLFDVSADYLLFGKSHQNDIEKSLVTQLNCIRPEYQLQVKKILSALSELLSMQTTSSDYKDG